MKLIEFISGGVQGLILPIESELVLTSEDSNLGKNEFSLSGSLEPGCLLTFQYQDEDIYLNGWKRRNVKLVDNKIYSISGIKFFIFKDGNRNPKIKAHFLKQYHLFIILFLLLNLVLTITSLIVIKNFQNNNVDNYLYAINKGYIKDGKIYVFDKEVKEKLPSAWLDSINMVSTDNQVILPNLNVDIISKNNNKIPFEIINKEEYSQILIEYPEKKLNIMSALGEQGIIFKFEGDLLLVNNVIKASQILKSIGYENEVSKLQLINNDAEIIDAKHFPYAIFFSSQGLSYIYDQQSRYWEGGTVPKIGRIESITNDKVIFMQGNKKKIYFIQK